MKYTKFLIALALCIMLPINARICITQKYEKNDEFMPKAWNYEEVYENYNKAIENLNKNCNADHSEFTKALEEYNEARWVIRLLSMLAHKTKVELGLLKNSSLLNTSDKDSMAIIKANKIIIAKIFSNIDYLTDEEQRQQGWPIDIGVPRNMTPQEKEDLISSINKEIDSQVTKILMWVKDPRNLPLEKDDTIKNRAIKQAQKISSLVESQRSYWERYAPQFMQTGLHVAKTVVSRVLESIKNRIYPTTYK